MTTQSTAQKTAGPGEIRDRLMQRVETRLGGILTQEHDRRVTTDRRAAALVSDLGALVRVGYRLRAALCVAGYLA
ncbi:hypothetical protein AB0O00_25965, partial [Kitasatospora sp. NPDC093558]